MAMIFDADGMAVGRLGAVVAKSLLKGENAVVLNAEKAVITGDRRGVIAKYAARRAVKNKANPEHSPHWPRRPDMLVRRIIRGMLPFDKAKGRDAYKRLHVVMGAPEEFNGKERAKLGAKAKLTGGNKYISILDLSNELGWNSPI